MHYTLFLIVNMPATSSFAYICLLLCSQHFRLVPTKLYCLFIIIVSACSLSVCSLAFSCFQRLLSNWFAVLGYYTFIEHVCSPKFTVFYCIIGLCFVKDFLLLYENWSILKLLGMHCLCNRYNWRLKKFFCFFLLRIDPSNFTALCISHCSNLSFCLLHLICLHLSCSTF